MSKLINPKNHQKQYFVITDTIKYPEHPIVEEFRMFRDSHLNIHPFGRVSVRLYYVLGPFLAAIIDRSNLLRKLSLIYS